MTRGMMPEDLYQIQWLSDPQLSPDGSAVAFTVTRLEEDADDYRAAIWIVPAAGGDARRFSRGPDRDTAPRWSPDGTQLAFLSNRDGGKPQIYIIDVAAGEARCLTSLAQGAGPPVWSPDGRHLATVARTSADDGEDRERPKNPPARVITTLKYRANGEGFIYDRRRHLFLVDVDTGASRQLTDGDWDDIQPAWSPNGDRIAFVSARHPDREYDHAQDIFVVNIAGGEPAQVTPGGDSVALPAWSPDGSTIAYLGHENAEDAPRNSRLWLIAPDGSARRCLTAKHDQQLETSDQSAPVWSVDGKAIYTGALDRGGSGVVAVQVADGAVTPRVAGLRSVDAFSLGAGSDVVAFVASDPQHPAEVFISDGDGERKLTDLNADWRAQVKLSAPEHFTARANGIDLDVWVMRPAGFSPDRRCPALLNIHGGPFSQYGWNFFDEFQVQAGAGYAIVYCNPRGSSGRDDAFARAIIGAPGEPDSADVLAALDAALQRFDWIDRQHTGIIGGSYGGYLTSWVIGHSDRFVVACSERALNNRYSKEGTSDIWSGYTYLRVRQWEDPDLYRRFSPISYVRDMHTPVLILHSEEDIRCPIEQGEQLFVALKQLRRPVRFVRFPGENHELSRNGKPSHRLQRFQHILDWFGDHLKLHEEGAPATIMEEDGR